MQVLLQTSASGELCPTDVPAEAAKFWKGFFMDMCQIDWEDVPSALQDDIEKSHTFHLEKKDGPSGGNCRIVTSLSEGQGAIMFDVVPPTGSSATGEGWDAAPSTAVYEMSEHGKVKETIPCDIFGDGIPLTVDLPSSKVNDVFKQVKEDYDRECGATDDATSLILANDASVETIRAKQLMPDDQGRPVYAMKLRVAAPGKDDMEIHVVAAEDLPSDDESVSRNLNTMYEEQIQQRAEEFDAKTQAKKLFEKVSGRSSEDSEDTSSYIQRKVRVMSSASDDERLEAEQNEDADASAPRSSTDGMGPGDRGRKSNVGDLYPFGAPGSMILNVGKLRVLDDFTLPLLCCLCGQCPDPNACTEGADGLARPHPAMLEEDNAKIREQQELLHGEHVPNKLLQVRTAPAGSPEEQRPPPMHGDVPRRSDFRVRSEPGYGDNFFAHILPRRSAEDHKKVWAQSRALIETANASGVDIPDSYHFYDSPITARCFIEPYDQGKCGSCWSFAALGALEKQICMRSHGDVRASLSREMLVRCSEQNKACGGGNADKAYEDLMEIGGVFSTDCLPYQGDGSKHCPVFQYSWFGQAGAGKTSKFGRIDQEMQSSCHDLTRYSNRPPMGQEWDMPFRMMYEGRFGDMPDMNDEKLLRYKRNFAKSRSRDRVPSWWLYGEDAMKVALKQYGSMYAGFKVRNDFKGRECEDGCWPPGTVYGEEPEFKAAQCGCGKGHAVHIIGYGEDIQETGVRVPYWLIENSWGSNEKMHGDVFGEDVQGLKGWGFDPFTELHPMDMEEKCLLAGWAWSAVPRSGGCSGNENVDIREDVMRTGGVEDGMHFSVMIDGVMKGNWSVAEDRNEKIMLPLDITPGPHNVTLLVYAKDHPKLQSFPTETYGIKAMSIRCRGKGYSYSFTKNDTKAVLSWGRKTRKELKAAADALIPTNSDPEYLYGKCEEPCRTGRYSWAKPCLGLLTDWGSCYTDGWAWTSNHMMSHKKANCTPCDENLLKLEEKAYATRSLDDETYLKWFTLVEQSWDAPDEPGWLRQNTGQCRVTAGGFVKNAQLSVTYSIDMPGHDWCDERQSAPYAKGKFVHAPGFMEDGSQMPQRCPPPLLGEVQLECRKGVLYAKSNSCSLRPGADETLPTKVGYYKMLRGANYHGIESGASFAIAEMSRFAQRCPTMSWTRWSECNVSTPCQKGVQHRSREPISLSKDDDKCAGLMFHEERSCVGPGFCPQVLSRFAISAGADIEQFLHSYKAQSTTIISDSYATAGAVMMSSSTPTCEDARYWCKLTTGKDTCDMYMEGHFEVRKDAEYFFHYETEGYISGELEFNTMGEGNELKPQYRVSASDTGAMYEWQDLGFHHRRRRTGSKPWEEIASMKLSKGTYYARMTLAGWSECPTYNLRLEQLSAVYRPPLILGARNTAAAYASGGPGEKAAQKRTTWWNNWGAIDDWYKNYRGKYSSSSYAPLKEESEVNELVLRDAPGGVVIKRVPITKFNFTAEEMYTLLDINKLNLPHAIERYGDFELVIRSTVILPEEGDYLFKFLINTEYHAANQAWHLESRRRHTSFHIRAGVNSTTGEGGQTATFKAYQGSATKTVSFKAEEAGTIPFEASIICSKNAPDYKMVLPNFVMMEMKRKDMLHGDTLELGTTTKYMSDMDAIRGDNNARIDWPERDDPLSSELKTQTFQELPPQSLLIGMENMLGFAAEAEAKIDAGACTSLEAWANDVDKSNPKEDDFWGVGVNLCDVDGANQFLEMVTYHPPKAMHANVTNNSMKQIGWVHVGFTQPTHMRMVRDPLNLGKFSVAYRPDDRQFFATPFAPVDTGFVGKMEVGVSMNSGEAYRYAEFYNISIEACPESCNDVSGEQLFCGEFITPCGNKLSCGGTDTCSDANDVCRDNMCMKCPPMELTEDQQEWECGTIEQNCLNHKGQKVQIHRHVGTVDPPSPLHFCKPDNTWHCVSQSKWAFLAEGYECGVIEDNCGVEVQLFDCRHPNDVCEAHKCKCTPTPFAEDNNCGEEHDGCGKMARFGELEGRCPGSNDRCLSNKCCTPLTQSDFPGMECGAVPDGCEGHVELQREGTAPAPYFPKPQESTTSNYLRGQAGSEIIAAEDLVVLHLARGLQEGKESLEETSPVSIWDVENKELLGTVDIGPDVGTATGGYVWVALPEPVKLKAGKKYRITMKVWSNMKDKYSTKAYYSSQINGRYTAKFGDFKGQIHTYDSDGYPDDKYPSPGRMVGLVNFDAAENEGCGAGPYECNDNKCNKLSIQGFKVQSGDCAIDGMCVTSPNYPSNYGNDNKCTIQSGSIGNIVVKDYEAAMYYDYLTFGATRYSRRRPPTSTPTNGDKVVIQWKSSSRQRRRRGAEKGWKLCMEVGEEENSTLLQESELSEEELSEEELQQLRDEEEAEAAAEKAELEREAAEMEAAEKEGHFGGSSGFLRFDEDELSLPDLTS
jgi:hypothetical protein